MILNRRSLILGAASLLAAPAIVRAESLMKIVAPRQVPTFQEWVDAMTLATIRAHTDAHLFGMGAIEYVVDGLPRAIDPFEFSAQLGNQVDFFQTIEYDDQPFKINWNPPDPRAGSEIARKDWPFKTIRLRA